MKLKIVATALFAASVVLAACSSEGTVDKGSKEENSSTGKETVNIKELVSDYSAANLEDQSASITSQQLIITDSDENKTVYDLPKDEFFVSIAPYINETHP